MNGLSFITMRAAAILALLLLIPILLIRAQPYDVSTVEALLLPPEGCAAPCFLGLKPGKTTLNEAVTFFEHRPGVDYFVERPRPYLNIATLNWRDNRTQYGGALFFSGENLAEIRLTGLEVQQIWLALGDPDGTQMASEILYLGDQRIIVRPTAHIGYYPVNDFKVTFASACTAFWEQDAYVAMGEFVIPATFNNTVSLARQRQNVCEKEREFQRANLGG